MVTLAKQRKRLTKKQRIREERMDEIDKIFCQASISQFVDKWGKCNCFEAPLFCISEKKAVRNNAKLFFKAKNVS